jgi:translation initiation factor 1
MEIDPKTGLPVEAIEWEDLAKTDQSIQVALDKKRYGKMMTVISGFDKEIDLKKISKSLKNKFACGGTFDKEKRLVELQGDHKEKVKKALIELGFSGEAIEK